MEQNASVALDEHISWCFLYRSSGSPDALSALMKTDIDVDFLTKQQRIEFSEILDIDDNSPMFHTWNCTSYIFPGTPDESPDDPRYAKPKLRGLKRVQKETRRFDELFDGLPPGPIGIIDCGIDVIGTDVDRLLEWKDTQLLNRSMPFILAVKDVEYQPEDRVDLIHGWCSQGYHLVTFSSGELADRTSPKMQSLQRVWTRKGRAKRRSDGSGIKSKRN